MGNQAGSLKKHIETAEKTGALNFAERGLEKFPPELVKVTGNLRNLDLSSNKIGSLPQNIGAFKMLKNLNISKNRLSDLPDDLGKLVKLETLNLSFNSLLSIPASFNHLKHLREIQLSNNNISQFPASLVQLKQLNMLDLSHNKLTAVPDVVGGLEATELVLNCNQIQHVSPAISSCPRLKVSLIS